MKYQRPIGVKALLMKKNLITIGIIISGVLSIIMALLTYYGSYSGNFIVIVDSEDRIRSIVLSETEDFENASPRLFADSVNDTSPLAFIDINLRDAVAAEGNYIDPDFKYFSYSFYITNNGNQVVDLETRYLITESLRNIDDAIRVIVVKDEDIQNLSIFKKEDKVSHVYDPMIPEAKIFYDEDKGVVFSELVEDFKPGDKIKYTIIAYVEGDDPDSTDALQGGRIRMTLRFNIILPEED